MKIKLFFIILCSIPFTVFSQENKRIDSLNNVLKRKIQDTVKIRTLLDLAIIQQDININLSSKTAENAYNLIKKTNYKKKLSYYYLIKSREYNLKSDYKKAFYFANLAYSKSLKDGDERIHLKSCEYKALTINGNNMDFKKSILFLEKKLDSINKKKIHLELGDLYLSLAASYSRDNKFNSAIKNFMIAIKIYDAKNYPLGVKNCYFEICDIYTYTGDYKNALLYSNKTIDLATKHNLNSKREKTINLAKAGEIQYKLGNFKKAEILLTESFKYCNEIGDEYNRMYILSNITQNNIELKKYEKVISLCKNELESRKLDKEHAVVFYNYLALSYSKSNNLHLAKKYIDKAISLCNENEIGLIEYRNNIAIYNNAASIYFKLKEYKIAYSYLDKYNKISEKINAEHNAQKIETIQAEFNLIDKELEIKNLKLAEQTKDIKLANQLKNIYLIISLMFIFVLITVLIFIVYRNSVKNNKALKNKNLIIQEKNQLLQKAITEKDLLIKEIHHRVKNNLQLVMSLLNIQSRKNKNKDIVEFIEKSQARIASMALIHQNLYNSENLSFVDFNNYLNQLLRSITNSQDINTENIKFHISTNKISFDIQTAIPLGLVVNELICNSLKYAFLENKKNAEIKITLTKNEKNQFTLLYEDNGIGYDDLEIKKDSIGIKLITLLIAQLNGNISHINDNGTKYHITFIEVLNKIQ